MVAVGKPVSCIYVDNVLVGEAAKALDRWKEVLRSHGASFHEIVEASPRIGYVGYGIDCSGPVWFIHNTRSRVWRLFKALRYVVRSRKASPPVLEVVVGHLIHCFMVRPSALSCLCYVYDVIHGGATGMPQVPPKVPRELRIAIGAYLLGELIGTSAGGRTTGHVGRCQPTRILAWLARADPDEFAHICRYRER